MWKRAWAFATRAARAGAFEENATLTRREFLSGCTDSRSRKESITPSRSAASPGFDASRALTAAGSRGPPNSGSSRSFSASITRRASERLCKSLYWVWK